MSKLYSYPKNKIKVLLLEGIHEAAVETFRKHDYTEVELLSHALSEDELIARLQDGVHILGIRSKTQVTKRVLEQSSSLYALGCYCIGTNQVDLDAAAEQGVLVFNAPFSNTRSVAELAIGNIIMLARKAAMRSAELHQGVWTKSAAGCYEVRNKTLGIIGYGHIGPQVGTLAESLGMRVLFYDIVPKLALGTMRATATLDELLEQSDFVSLHVPETPETKNMIAARELSLMKAGSYLLNLARGTVVDLDALKDAVESGHIAGAAFDVFPVEPKSNAEPFNSVVRGLPNVILTPHIGASTLEAQKNIGIEVATSQVSYMDLGSSTGAVNFPNVQLPVVNGSHRVLYIHRNIPGVLGAVNGIVADLGANISAQYLATNADIGYLIMDVDQDISRSIKDALDGHEATIKTRLLF